MPVRSTLERDTACAATRTQTQRTRRRMPSEAATGSSMPCVLAIPREVVLTHAAGRDAEDAGRAAQRGHPLASGTWNSDSDGRDLAPGRVTVCIVSHDIYSLLVYSIVPVSKCQTDEFADLLSPSAVKMGIQHMVLIKASAVQWLSS